MHLQDNKIVDLGVKVIRNVATYPLHYAPYVVAKFGVATFNTLGGDALARKYIIDL